MFPFFFILFYLMQSKDFKIQKFPPIGRHAIEFFCFSLSTDYEIDLCKMFQATCLFDINLKYLELPAIIS